jgi:hypothetical protein
MQGNDGAAHHSNEWQLAFGNGSNLIPDGRFVPLGRLSRGPDRIASAARVARDNARQTHDEALVLKAFRADGHS